MDNTTFNRCTCLNIFTASVFYTKYTAIDLAFLFKNYIIVINDKIVYCMDPLS